MNSLAWQSFECGEIEEDECYAKITEQFGLEPNEWRQTIEELDRTLRPHHTFAQGVKDLKATYPGLKVHVFSNVSVAHFERLRPVLDEWGIFDTHVTSASIGYRKPDLVAYEKLLKVLRERPENAVFVDDRHENVINAHSLGFQGILFENDKDALTRLHNLLGDQVERGMGFLRQNAGNLFSESDKGVVIKEYFTQLLIFQAVGERNLVELQPEIWNFFIGKPMLTDEVYPSDSDTVSLAAAVLDGPTEHKTRVMDMIMQHLTADGLPLMYLDHQRPRCCPFVCANVLRLFFLNGRGLKLIGTLKHMERILETGAFEIPTRYCLQPEWLFHYLSDLCARCVDPVLDPLRQILTRRLQERMGCDKDIIGAAMRVVSAQDLGLKNPVDLRTLREAQELDGGWPFTWMWRWGTVDVRMGGRYLPTAIAIKALKTARDIEIQETTSAAVNELRTSETSGGKAHVDGVNDARQAVAVV